MTGTPIPGDVTPAATQAAGLEMPALSRASATFCWGTAKVLAVPEMGSRPVICGRVSYCVANGWVEESDRKSSSLLFVLNENKLIESENPRGEKELIGSASTTGCGPTSMPGLSARVPRMNSEFLGLMQYSSTLILLLVTTPWRDRKLLTLPGASSRVEKNEPLNSSWKSRCRSRSAPRGSTSRRPVLSSTKKGRCMHSPATLTHFLFLPRCLYSQTSVR